MLSMQWGFYDNQIIGALHIVYKEGLICVGFELCKQFLPTDMICENGLVGKNDAFEGVLYKKDKFDS